MFHYRITSLSMNLFILASSITFWTIVSVVLTASNAGYAGAYKIGFEGFLKVYNMSLPFFWDLIPQIY